VPYPVRNVALVNSGTPPSTFDDFVSLGLSFPKLPPVYDLSRPPADTE
jgi:hypothetical protein